jgi:uncharacterized protein involved in exopolysaccharide biosynthesis
VLFRASNHQRRHDKAHTQRLRGRQSLETLVNHLASCDWIARVDGNHRGKWLIEVRCVMAIRPHLTHGQAATTFRMTMTIPTTDLARDDAAQPMSLLGLVTAIAERWRMLLILGLSGAIIAALWSLFAVPRFRATLKFALEVQNINPSISQLSALAGQFGVNGPQGTRSLQFYADVLTSESLLRRIAEDSFPGSDGTPQRLVDILRISGDSPRERLANAVSRLQRGAVNTSTNDRTGTVKVDVLLPDPQLASAVAEKLFDELQVFNGQSMRSSATERRRFAEREATRARTELDSAETVMRAFLDANRGDLGNSPRLTFQRARIQRRLDLLSDQFRRLEGEREQARIDAVRDTPVLTMVEAPVPPIYRDSPRRVRMTLTGGIIGGLVALAIIALEASGRSAMALDAAGFQRLRAALRRR